MGIDSLGTILQNLVFDSLTYALVTQKLSIELRTEILNLIPKPNCDLRLMRSWCPITLLNTIKSYLRYWPLVYKMLIKL